MALLRFSDVLAAQANDELPYSSLKTLLRALKAHHPSYPRRSRRPDGCTQVCTLSPTQIARDASDRKHERSDTFQHGTEVEEVLHVNADEGARLEDGGKLVQSPIPLDTGKSHNPSQQDSQSPDPYAFNPDDTDQDAFSLDDWPDPSATVTDDLRDIAASQSLPLDSSQTSQERIFARSPLADKNCRDYSSRHSPTASKGTQSTISLPVISRLPSPHPSPRKRRRTGSPPPSHAAVGATINALLNTLVQHDSERGECVKWVHLRQQLLDKDFSFFKTFCASMDRVFEPLDPLAAYKGDRGENSQSSARMCVFYSNLFWQDAWKDFCRDSTRNPLLSRDAPGIALEGAQLIAAQLR